MNRVVHAHVKSIMPENPVPDEPIFFGGGCRPNVRFQELCNLAGIKFKLNVESGADVGVQWVKSLFFSLRPALIMPIRRGLRFLTYRLSSKGTAMIDDEPEVLRNSYATWRDNFR